MRSGLFWKLFLLQMLAAAALLAGALAVTRAYSVRSFGEFLEKQERETVEQLASQLAQAYEQRGDLLDAARTVPVLWSQLQDNGPFCDGPGCPPPEMGFVQSRRGPAPGPDGEPSEDPMVEVGPEPGEREPSDRLLEIRPEPDDFRRPPRALRFRSRDGIAGVRFAAGPMTPLQLLDADGNYLHGSREPFMAEGSRATIEANGEVVGYLVRPRFPRPREQIEFARQQSRRYAVIAPVALAVAALFAALITALIVRPIRQLSAGATALARREFGTRMPVGRRDEIGHLAGDFNRLAEALERFDSRQRQWLADIAHELRTPLAVLRGELDALLEGVRTFGPGTVESLRQEVSRLEGLINDLHLVSLAESGGLRLNLSDSDVGGLAELAAQRFAPRFRTRDFQLTTAIEPGLRARVDVQRLDQVLGNLLGNAIAHATPPGPVTVSARAEAAQVVVSVTDAGPGVPDDALPRLFDRLFRVESARSRPSGGSGLGLSICKSIVEAHGGTIDAQKSAAGGLEIVIRLPRT